MTCIQSPAAPRSSNVKTVMGSAAAVYTFTCHDSWKGSARKSQGPVTGIAAVRH